MSAGSGQAAAALGFWGKTVLVATLVGGTTLGAQWAGFSWQAAMHTAGVIVGVMPHTGQYIQEGRDAVTSTKP